jgi:hypothetical protein
VLSILPSLFEEFIDIDDKKFYTKKIAENRYLCFAYNEQKISDAIKNSNLLMSQVKNIYFGQIELESYISSKSLVCMKIDDICLGFSKEILVQVPIQVNVNTNNDIDISQIKLSKHNISILSSSKYISSRNSYIVSSIIVLFALTIFSKIFINNQIISLVPNKIDTIRVKYNMPNSNLQLNSIIKKLNKISKKQILLRDVYKYLFNFKSKNDGTMISCEYKNSSFIVKFKNIKAQKIINYLEKRYILKNKIVENKIITIGFDI